MKKLVALLIVSLAFATTPAFSDDFQKGLDAYNSRDYATALAELQSFAEQGNARAQWVLGQLYSNGWGISQDYKQAAKWFRLSAEQGYARSQFWMGDFHYRGNGVPKNLSRAYMWFNIGASNGNESSAKARDLIATEMNYRQIEKGQDLAHECVVKDYKGC